ncbi:hypothetical protein E4631_08820 [Hymenobacter sp. UV11]|uniref:hypothetical protein n=1 Tax=Hymenobacter sp. UV11 TaxID=1849735 RepID=UPI001060BB25|nr:hypothetical protein [Hymenobacter sp. UV11]TDN36331.1 hypothetical protein A8B98_10525 [Hymenobacter sp. UV11]TFZ67045.1 hypothetical protein E4631_08820 [Hymenobacter sp. UV11]
MAYYTTGEDFHDPELHVQVPGSADGSLQEIIIDVTLQQFKEKGQSAGIFMLAVDVTALARARAELAALRAPGGQFGAVAARWFSEFENELITGYRCLYAIR